MAANVLQQLAANAQANMPNWQPIVAQYLARIDFTPAERAFAAATAEQAARDTEISAEEDDETPVYTGYHGARKTREEFIEWHTAMALAELRFQKEMQFDSFCSAYQRYEFVDPADPAAGARATDVGRFDDEELLHVQVIVGHANEIPGQYIFGLTGQGQLPAGNQRLVSLSLITTALGPDDTLDLAPLRQALDAMAHRAHLVKLRISTGAGAIRNLEAVAVLGLLKLGVFNCPNLRFVLPTFASPDDYDDVDPYGTLRTFHCEHCPSMTALQESVVRHGVSDVTLASLMPAIRRLRFSSCARLTFNQVEFADVFPELYSLWLEQLPALERDSMFPAVQQRLQQSNHIRTAMPNVSDRMAHMWKVAHDPDYDPTDVNGSIDPLDIPRDDYAFFHHNSVQPRREVFDDGLCDSPRLRHIFLTGLPGLCPYAPVPGRLITRVIRNRESYTLRQQYGPWCSMELIHIHVHPVQLQPLEPTSYPLLTQQTLTVSNNLLSAYVRWLTVRVARYLQHRHKQSTLALAAIGVRRRRERERANRERAAQNLPPLPANDRLPAELLHMAMHNNPTITRRVCVG